MFTKRSFLWFLMIGLTAGAIYFTDEAIRYSTKLESWIKAVPAEFAVDLSQPGGYTGSLELITTRTCKLGFYVKLHTNQRIDDNLLKGLRGNVFIKDNPHDPLHILPLVHDYFVSSQQYSNHLLTLASVNPWEIGKYRMVVSVHQGAEKLRGIKQSFVVKYELCGLEYWPDYLHKAVAAFFGLGALIVGLYLFSSREQRLVMLT